MLATFMNGVNAVRWRVNSAALQTQLHLTLKTTKKKQTGGTKVAKIWLSGVRFVVLTSEKCS